MSNSNIFEHGDTYLVSITEKEETTRYYYRHPFKPQHEVLASLMRQYDPFNPDHAEYHNLSHTRCEYGVKAA